MVSISVRVATGAVVDEYEMSLPCKRVAFFNGNVRDLPEWMIDKIVPTTQTSLEIGEVWTGWNKKLSLTIRGTNGYHIADKGSLIIDHGSHRYQIIKLEPVDWANHGKKATEDSPHGSRA